MSNAASQSASSPTPAPAVPDILDHLIVAGPSLAGAIDYVEQVTGVRAQPSGVHPTGTANALIAFTVDGRRVPWYLEVIGPDPERTTDEPITTFGIAGRTQPAVATWAIHPEAPEATAEAGRREGVQYGPRTPLSRRTPTGDLLEWSLFRLGGEAPDPLTPFLIDWGATAHPGHSDLPTLELLSVHAEHPDPARLDRQLQAVGAPLQLRQTSGPAALVVTVTGLGGPIELR